MPAEHTFTITEATAADDALRLAAARLIPQLSPSSPPPTVEHLRRIVDDPATTLLVATAAASANSAVATAVANGAPSGLASGGGRSSHENGSSNGSAPDGEPDGTVVGMLTLAMFMLPTGVRAWIEDVVVDDEARGAGVASALVAAAIELAEEHGARTVDLTSRPEREAANRLYEHLGFTRRQTNVYRKTLRLPR